MNLKAEVRRALEAAHANGYFFVGLTPEEIAVDMTTYDAALEGQDVGEIARMLEELGSE